MFTVTERKDILDKLNDIMINDIRVVGLVLVGSGSIGFNDEFSDIDLLVVVKDDLPITEALNDFEKQIKTNINLIDIIKVSNASRNLLVCLHESFLEIDIGFVYLSEVQAKKKNWKILYDTTDTLDKLMRNSIVIDNILQDSQFDIGSTWNNFLHCYIAINRNELFRAYKEIHILIDFLVELKAKIEKYESKRYRDVDKMDYDFLETLKNIIPVQITKESLYKTLDKVLYIYQAFIIQYKDKVDYQRAFYILNKLNDLML